MVSELEIVLRFVLASVLGGVIGLEREVHGREAGGRTYLLVSLGSALIMVISEFLVVKYHGGPLAGILRGDPGRIAAQAVTGIGFLGAGVILRYRDSIRGLTTAACMWVVCAIGLAIGSGYYLFGLTGSGITLFSLLGLKGLGKRLKKDWYLEMVVISEDIDGQIDRIQKIIDKYDSNVTRLAVKRSLRDKEITLNFHLRSRATQPDRNMYSEVFDLSGIKQVELK
ncbi:MAG TPA: MgtC/SapB family protein [Thermodesulfobacteriota bacterium]|nr:MgtC/SapB family protein [Thermodesulfobacteriota bacterium]